MKSKLSILLIVLVVSISGCKVTGPADDEFDTKDDNGNSGRVFSKDGSALTVFTNDKNEKSALFNSNKESGSQTSSGSSPASDYENYKQWQNAKQADSAEYEKFKKWQEFEEYNRWKEQQKK